jgi:fumarate hydratase, class II
MRIEKDTLGAVEVPENAYYGAQTQRAFNNFKASGKTFPAYFIEAYLLIKKACARANAECGKLEVGKKDSIVEACERAKGLTDQFIVDVFQAGAGTSFNMNVNEVVANLAAEILGKEKGDHSLIHPHDHVNMSQSTNDTFPTASHLAVIWKAELLLKVVHDLAEAFKAKSSEFSKVVKSGRTHLMDATPVTIGHEFGAYATSLERCADLIKEGKEILLEVPLGSTATGSGDNTPEGFKELALVYLSELTGLSLRKATDSFESLQSRFGLSVFSGYLNVLARELNRIANDLRLLNSGPTTGLAEIMLPAVQPGSSIMPGKVNPVMAECLNMICFKIIGNHTTVSEASQAGQLELNVMTPVMTSTILESLELLINYLPDFQKLCVEGLGVNKKRCRELLLSNPALATLLSPEIGYDRAAELAGESLEKGIPVPELAVEKGLITKEKAVAIFKRLDGKESYL